MLECLRVAKRRPSVVLDADKKNENCFILSWIHEHLRFRRLIAPRGDSWSGSTSHWRPEPRMTLEHAPVSFPIRTLPTGDARAPFVGTATGRVRVGRVNIRP